LIRRLVDDCYPNAALLVVADDPLAPKVVTTVSVVTESGRRDAPVDVGVAEIVRRLNHPAHGDKQFTTGSCDGHGVTLPYSRRVPDLWMVEPRGHMGARLRSFVRVWHGDSPCSR